MAGDPKAADRRSDATCLGLASLDGGHRCLPRTWTFDDFVALGPGDLPAHEGHAVPAGHGPAGLPAV